MTMPDRIWAWPSNDKATSGRWRADDYGFHASDMDGGTEYAPVCQHPTRPGPADTRRALVVLILTFLAGIGVGVLL